MPGFVHNVLGGAVHGVEHLFDYVYHELISLFSPVAAAVAAAFKANGKADFAAFMVAVGQAVNAGKKGNNLLLAIEGAAEAQGVRLGAQILAAFAASVEFNFQPKATPAAGANDPGAPQ